MRRLTRQRLELRFEDATMADEPRENRPKVARHITRLAVRRRADHKEAPGNRVRAVVDHRQASGAVPALLIGPDQMLVIEGSAFDQIAADEAIKLRENEFPVLKREMDDPCFCRDRVDQQGGDGGSGVGG